MKPHKHAELIKAWADGAEIEVQCTNGTWSYCEDPNWHRWVEYRIKPEPKPDMYIYAVLWRIGCGAPMGLRECGEKDANILLVFDGEGCSLKAAKVLK